MCLRFRLKKMNEEDGDAGGNGEGVSLVFIKREEYGKGWGVLRRHFVFT